MGNGTVNEVEQRLRWDAPDLARLGAFVRSYVLPFAGEAHSFSASSSWGSKPTTRRRYDSPGEWEDSLSSAPDETELDAYSGGAGRRVSLRLYESGRRGSITVTAPDADVEEARGLVAEMARALGLTPSDAKKEARAERVYQTGEANGREWFSSFTSFMEETAGGAADARCSYWVSGPPEWEYIDRDVARWQGDVLADWEKVSRLSCDLHGPDESVTTDWDLTSGEFRLGARAADESRVRALLDALDARASLPPLARNPYNPSLQGEQNYYFIKKPSSWEWLNGAVEALFEHVGEPGPREVIHSDFSATPLGSQPKPVIWQEKEPWLEFVRENWTNLLHARCYVSSRKLNFTFECEPPHDWVALRVQAQTRARVQEITQELQERLELQPIEGASYGPVRSSGYYSVGKWSNEHFARAVERAVAQFPKHSVRQAVVIEEKGKSEREHRDFADVPAFLARLGQGKPYLEAHLQIKGPLGAQTAVHATDKCSKLELKSHQHPDKFPDLVKLFDDELDLKKIAETKEEAESKGRSWKDSLLVLVGLPLFLSVLTSTLLSDQFKNAAIPKRSLQIVNPHSADGKAVALTGRQVDVYWRLQTERWFSKSVDPNVPANYRLFGNGKLLREGSNVRPGVPLELAPGAYQIEITSVPYNEQTSLTFVVSPDPGDSPAR